MLLYKAIKAATSTTVTQTYGRSHRKGIVSTVHSSPFLSDELTKREAVLAIKKPYLMLFKLLCPFLQQQNHEFEANVILVCQQTSKSDFEASQLDRKIIPFDILVLQWVLKLNDQLLLNLLWPENVDDVLLEVGVGIRRQDVDASPARRDVNDGYPTMTS